VGFSGSHLRFIGGLVPSLLVPVLDPGIGPHVGSGDIDLCFSVPLASGDTGAYARIEKALRALDYKMKPQGENSASSWQWVGGVRALVTVEFFCAPIADNAPGTLYRPSGDVTKGLSALTLATGGLIDRDLIELNVKLTLPNGDSAAIPFKVTAPAAFLASKSDALTQREKNKDAYDIVWLCEAWPGGQATRAEVIRRSPIFEDTLMRKALADLKLQFASIDAVGARAYGRFVEPLGASSLDVSSRRAMGAVQALLSAIRVA